MADKENAATAPRLTRAAAAAVTAKRVALSELPNAVLQPHPRPKKSSHVPEPKKPAPTPAPDLADEDGDLQLYAPYASDIYSYLRSMEVEAKRRPTPDYIETVQVNVKANMRAILVDWLVEVAEEARSTNSSPTRSTSPSPTSTDSSPPTPSTARSSSCSVSPPCSLPRCRDESLQVVAFGSVEKTPLRLVEDIEGRTDKFRGQ